MNCIVKKQSGVILKIDFEEAYDKVRWPFLVQALQMKGFSSQWISWVQSFISDGSVAVNVNDEVGPYFQTKKGLRQGDPLSPILFNIVANMLAILVNRAKVDGQINGVVPHLVDGDLSILQYADDTIIFMNNDLEHAHNMKLLLCAFEQVSSLKINFHKSEIFCGARKLDRIHAIIGEKLRSALRKSSVVEKANIFQLVGDQGSFGNVTRKNANTALPNEIYCANLKIKEGIHNLDIKNKALLSKWLYNLLISDGTWQQILRNKYLRTFLINKGSQVRFWEDRWLGQSTLREQYPCLYNIARYKQAIIAVNLQPNGKFSVKSHYLALIHTDVPNINKRLWSLKAPLKIKVFLWYLRKGVVLTKDNLAKRNWQGSYFLDYTLALQLGYSPEAIFPRFGYSGVSVFGTGGQGIFYPVTWVAV
ncbi:LOW QUALITY PROTEIN: hypothetical protein U9M48_009545 [Paspalum notatum var. saurae]|uniref:Reverse transcriptase domain-containing protein n=1 Tax=Paspalum notatum var. saurae TaxID=547442 RepID=A0AAQ3SR51_PASNO